MRAGPRPNGPAKIQGIQVIFSGLLPPCSRPERRCKAPDAIEERCGEQHEPALKRPNLLALVFESNLTTEASL